MEEQSTHSGRVIEYFDNLLFVKVIIKYMLVQKTINCNWYEYPMDLQHHSPPAHGRNSYNEYEWLFVPLNRRCELASFNHRHVLVPKER